MNDLLSGQGGPEPRRAAHADMTATCSRRETALHVGPGQRLAGLGLQLRVQPCGRRGLRPRLGATVPGGWEGGAWPARSGAAGAGAPGGARPAPCQGPLSCPGRAPGAGGNNPSSFSLCAPQAPRPLSCCRGIVGPLRTTPNHPGLVSFCWLPSSELRRSGRRAAENPESRQQGLDAAFLVPSSAVRADPRPGDRERPDHRERSLVLGTALPRAVRV